MQSAIIVRFVAPSDTKGCRLVAQFGSQRLIKPRDYSRTGEEDAKVLAEQLARRLGLPAPKVVICNEATGEYLFGCM